MPNPLPVSGKQWTGTVAGGTGATVTISSPTSGVGKMVVFACGYGGAAAAFECVTTGGTNVSTPAQRFLSLANNTVGIGLWDFTYDAAPTSVIVRQATPDGNFYAGVGVSEVSDLDSFDVVSTAENTGTANPAVATNLPDTTDPQGIVFGVLTQDNVEGGDHGPSATWTELFDLDPTNETTQTCHVIYKQTSAGANDPSWATPTNTGWRVIGVAYKGTAGGGSDTTPDAFSFTDQTGIALSTQVESNTITVAGIDAAAAISITGGGAEYRKNGGAYTSSPGTVNNGDTVQLRMTSSATGGTVVSTTLDIGGVTDVWTVTTLVAADLAASYAASAFVSADLAASYGAAGLVASDLAVSYSARELVNADLAASYAATAFVSADLAISYAGLGLAVYFREKLVNLSESPLANLTGLIAFVWHAEPSGSNVAPDEVLTSLTTDANGDPDWQLDLGSLANGDPVWLMVIRPGGPPYALTARRVVPTYVEE